MIGTDRRESNPKAIAAFLLIAFTISWGIWILGITLRGPADLLVFGAAGPAVAATVMPMRRSGVEKGHRRFPVGLFLLLTAVAWGAQVLAAAFRTPAEGLSWHPLLLLAGGLSAVLVANLCARDEIRLEWSGWHSLAVLSMPALLLIPAAIARFSHLPIVKPRPHESALMTTAVAVVTFAKEFLFAGLLEESGWRGWLLARFEQRWSPFVASLFVWLPWAIWHAPLDLTGGVGRTWTNYVEVRVVFFIPISILLTWFFNRSRGSIVVAALFHAAFNTFPFVFPYSPPFLALILVWAVGVVIADRMWRASSSFLLGEIPTTNTG